MWSTDGGGIEMILHELVNEIVQTRVVEVVFDEHYDLVVIGLGTAGSISLITAAREGVSVLGVEQLYGMGGTGTIGAINAYYFGAKGGLYTEIDEKAAELQNSVFAKKTRRDTKDLVLQREAKKSGAKVKYQCIVTGVYLEKNQVVGLKLFQEGKEMHIAAKKFIDATGEAYVCHIAGAESFSGRAFDKATQPFTFTNIVIGEHGETLGLNKDAGFVNQHDPREVSRTNIVSNTYPMYLKNSYIDEEYRFATISPLIGVREGRMIRGIKTLKFSDVISLEEQKEQPLFYTFCNIDNHGKNIAFEDEELCDWLVASGLWGVLFSVPVPVEVLIPCNLGNIMVAGRCLSVDHNLAAGVRMQCDMSKCGEAAAYVCCEAIKNACSLNEVRYKNIIDKLKSTRCLDEANNIGFMERVEGKYFGNPLPKLQTSDEITTWLASDKPGWGIWSAKILASYNHEIIEALEKNICSNDENLARNSAVALGLIGRKTALDKLREIAKDMDNYVPKSSLKYVYTRGVSAIYLLGKLKDISSIDLLFDIVENGGQTSIDNFDFGEFYCEEKDVFSQYVAFAARALIDIAKANNELKEQIISKLLKILEQVDYKIMITLRANSESLYDLKPKLIEYVKSI